MEYLTTFAELAGSDVQTVTLGLVFAGILLVTIGAAASFGRDEVERRYGATAASWRRPRRRSAWPCAAG